MNTDTLIQSIVCGDLDADIDRIQEAVRARQDLRRDIAKATNMAVIRIGQKVRVKVDANLRPQYILGQVATVVDKNRTKIVVTFDDKVAAGRFQGRVVIPADALESVAG